MDVCGVQANIHAVAQSAACAVVLQHLLHFFPLPLLTVSSLIDDFRGLIGTIACDRFAADGTRQQTRATADQGPPTRQGVKAFVGAARAVQGGGAYDRWTKKIPDRKKIDPGLPFASTEIYQVRRRPRSCCLNVQAGLLTPGSSYWLRLPDDCVSDMVQRSSPVTAAGPSPIRTEFPFKFLRTPEL
jgi:hypothetical protein